MAERKQNVQHVEMRRPSRMLGASLVLAVVGVGGLTTEVNAAAIYRENFTNTGTTHQPLSYAGWRLHRGASATELSDISDYPRITNAVAEPDAELRPSVNSNPTEADARNGFVYYPNNNNGTRIPNLAWTEEYSIDRSLYSDMVLGMSTNIASSPNTNPTSDAVRVAIRIGGNWFVSDPSYMTNQAWTTSWGAGYESALLSGNWYEFTFNPGSPFAVGGTATVLPAAGNIDAFGFFGEQASQSGNTRIGAFEIDATPVPEPMAMGLLGMAGMVALSRRPRAEC